MDIKSFFESQNWTFAKTYAEKAPHEYIVRGKHNGTSKEFSEAVEYIREHGFHAWFWRSEHVYLLLDNRLYWTMGAPVEETIIINRCDISDYRISITPNARGVTKE